MEYKTKGVCAREIKIDIENDIVKDIEFFGGCDGNHKGIINLVKGMKVDEVIDKLSGIRCGRLQTSCPDQLAQALKEYKGKN